MKVHDQTLVLCNDNSDADVLAQYGWEIDCNSPFEISNKDGSFARGEAALIVLQTLKQNDL